MPPQPDILTTSRGDWSQQLREAITNPSELLRVLRLDPKEMRLDRLPAFPLRVPRSFVGRMRPEDLADPLLRQVLPLATERDSVDGYVADPLAERAATLAPGIIQKYAGRALLITTPVCAIHCRYCFRREFPYTEHRLPITTAALRTLECDRSISEVILSGGDPFMLTDPHLARLVDALRAIPHLVRLRVHTRLPVVIPDRVTPELVAALAGARQHVACVVHVNHANELDRAVERALARLREAGIMLLNQSVLLAGVNDEAGALIDLSTRLFECGVLPYYLHLPDAVAGTHHFDVPQARARALHDAMRRGLPGYLVPRLAREVPGETSKLWL